MMKWPNEDSVMAPVGANFLEGWNGVSQDALHAPNQWSIDPMFCPELKN